MPATVALGEFELIDRYFRSTDRSQDRRRGVVLGIGDDAALLEPPPGQQLVAALDTLVEGRHFPHGSAPRSIGHRALAVNLSDLAAMGATPAWYLLALTLPRADEQFLGEFASGMLDLAREHDVALVGGDTTAGPLSVSVQVLGHVPPGEALLRSGAQPGDLLFVSGWPGEAAAGLQLQMHGGAHAMPIRRRSRHAGCATDSCIRRRAWRWAWRCAAWPARASMCPMDWRQMRSRSQWPAVAAWPSRRRRHRCRRHWSRRWVVKRALRAALTGGDDYELCFTLPASRLAELPERLINVKCPVTCIGVMEAQPGLRVRDQGRPLSFPLEGFDHFVT